MAYDSTDDTLQHIAEVRTLLEKIISGLNYRSYSHDASKLHNPEKEIFDIYTPRLKNLIYGSEEYKKNLLEM